MHIAFARPATDDLRPARHDFFGELAFPTAEEFWDVVPEYFPMGFPPHIKLPYAKPKKKKESKK